MSLQTCPSCKKANPYWKIYKEINTKRFKDCMNIKCEFCKNDMELNYGKISKFKMILLGIFWMSLPIGLIYFAYIGKVSYLMAMIFVTIFHFLAMFYIIKKTDYKIN